MELDGDLATLSTGVVLKLESPSPMALKDAMEAEEKKHPEPEVPKVWIEDQDRDEPNESDPDYRHALMLWQAQALERALTVFIVTGTTEHSRPENIIGPEDEAFREYLDVLGIVPAPLVLGRYLQWVKYVAAKDKDDLRELSTELARRAGTSEEDVQRALETFRGPPERSADNGARPRRTGADRNRVRKQTARTRS